jgi:hypothetical protein
MLLSQKKFLQHLNRAQIQWNRYFKLQLRLFRHKMLNLLYKYVKPLLKWLVVELRKLQLLQKDSSLFTRKVVNLVNGFQSN